MRELNDFSPESGAVSFRLLRQHIEHFIIVWECLRLQLGSAWWLVSEQYNIPLSSGLGQEVEGSERPSIYYVIAEVGIVPQCGSPAPNSHTD